nr:RelA/SpoT domain-containing protein [uncultured Flavobacterium sp.]
MEELEKEYKNIIEDYTDFLEEIKRMVEKILHRNQIPIAFGINGRIKTLDSIFEKVTSERFIIKNTVTELNDLIGLRIVLLFPEFKDKVVEILSTELKLLNDPNKSSQSPDKFGYSSIHLILGIKDEWIKVPSWENHSNKKIEVQVRTLSEHIWAETSHSLFYKREENIPNIINRDLYKLSALLEVVDDKLQALKYTVEEHFRYIVDAPYDEILKLDLNSETFRRVMFENSKGLYNLNDYKNKILSSKIEKDYNILNVNILDNIINDKIELKQIDTDKYIEKVIELLENEKLLFDEKTANK